MGRFGGESGLGVCTSRLLLAPSNSLHRRCYPGSGDDRATWAGYTMKSIETDNLQGLELERQRLAYCEKMYELERSRRELIERKTQVHLGLLTLLLAALSLQRSGMMAAGAYMEFVRTASPGVRVGLVASGISFAFFCLFSLLAIALVFQPRKRVKPSPKSLVASLFAEVQVGEREQHLQLIREATMRYALCVEVNSESNTKKAKWMVRASMAVLGALASFFLLLVMLAIAKAQVG